MESSLPAVAFDLERSLRQAVHMAKEVQKAGTGLELAEHWEPDFLDHLDHPGRENGTSGSLTCLKWISIVCLREKTEASRHWPNLAERGTGFGCVMKTGSFHPSYIWRSVVFGRGNHMVVEVGC